MAATSELVIQGSVRSDKKVPRGDTGIDVERRQGMWTIVLIILAIFLPPLAAFLVVGLGTHFWINLILTLLFWLPGTVHALWLIAGRSGAVNQ